MEHRNQNETTALSLSFIVHFVPFCGYSYVSFCDFICFVHHAFPFLSSNMIAIPSLLAILVSLPTTTRTAADEAPKALLPVEAVWVMRYDDKLDGELHAKPGGEVRWKLSVRNDRIAGSLAGMKEADPSDHHLAGEIVPGNPPIVSLRQDGPKGLVCYYTGKRVAADRIVGTWYDNRGAAGDFEFTPEKK